MQAAAAAAYHDCIYFILAAGLGLSGKT